MLGWMVPWGFHSSLFATIRDVRECNIWIQGHGWDCRAEATNLVIAIPSAKFGMCGPSGLPVVILVCKRDRIQCHVCTQEKCILCRSTNNHKHSREPLPPSSPTRALASSIVSRLKFQNRLHLPSRMTGCPINNPRFLSSVDVGLQPLLFLHNDVEVPLNDFLLFRVTFPSEVVSIHLSPFSDFTLHFQLFCCHWQC